MKQLSTACPAAELRVWTQYLVLAETLHFGRAAQKLGISQPPLTQAIQKLEAQLGATLFERTRRTVSLTPAGAALVEPVRRLLQDAGALHDVAQAAAHGETGLIRLGFVSTVGFDPLPRWLRSFRERYPHVSVELHEATSDVQLTALTRGELDAGFVLHAARMPENMSIPLPRLSVSTESLLYAVPAASGGHHAVAASDLLRQPLIIFPRQTAPSLYDAVISFYHRSGVVPIINQEAIQMQTIVNLVSAGLGVALVPAVVAKFRRAGVKFHPLPRAWAKAAPRCETTLIWRLPAPPVVLRFAEFVRAAKSNTT